MIIFFLKRFSQRRRLPQRKYRRMVSKINSLENTFKQLSDSTLKIKTNEFKQRLLNGEGDTKKKNKPPPITLEIFALVREASRRILGLRHFDMQLVGGLVLNEGKIAEMKTGEGKTLVALLPIFFYALYGNGTQVITVNDYLACRDANYVGQVHTFLGLSVGLIQTDMENFAKKKNYACDVVYVSNDALAFDYLKDNLVYSSEDIVQRPFFYGVIDEVDSILIDEARTPLIISGLGNTKSEQYKYIQAAKLSKALIIEVHYEIDKKTKNVVLTDRGTAFCEKALNIGDLFEDNQSWIFYVLNSLKAKEFFTKNKDYIINKNLKIIIVDQFTGRPMPGRRWSEGLHQAVEAKEGLQTQSETTTLASISYQSLFLLYGKLAGMTGTANTEAAEFKKIYGLRVVSIPTHRPIIRKDFADLIYKRQSVKWHFIAEECLEMNKLGRPILIGTTTVENSELLASLLNEYKLDYRLLNARPENVENESEIIAQAGCRKAITIATNMAGRGTDILLGGNSTFLTNNTITEIFEDRDPIKRLDSILNVNDNDYILINELKKNYKQFLKLSLLELKTEVGLEAKLFYKIYNEILLKKKQIVEESRQTILNLGGLHVIGTERHESRRIDNQLRGRAGRQGDPGSSRFFLSYEDELLQNFGGVKIKNLMERLDYPEETPMQSKFISRRLDSAQKKVETLYFNSRKRLFDYEQPINLQQNIIYAERMNILKQKNVRTELFELTEQILFDLYDRGEIITNGSEFVTFEFQALLSIPFFSSYLLSSHKDDSHSFFKEQIEISYDLKELEIDMIEVGLFCKLEKLILLEELDVAWAVHLRLMDCRKDSNRWSAYGEKDPLTKYKKDTFYYFILMFQQIRHQTVYSVMGIEYYIL